MHPITKSFLTSHPSQRHNKKQLSNILGWPKFFSSFSTQSYYYYFPLREQVLLGWRLLSVYERDHGAHRFLWLSSASPTIRGAWWTSPLCKLDAFLHCMFILSYQGFASTLHKPTYLPINWSTTQVIVWGTVSLSIWHKQLFLCKCKDSVSKLTPRLLPRS